MPCSCRPPPLSILNLCPSYFLLYATDHLHPLVPSRPEWRAILTLQATQCLSLHPTFLFEELSSPSGHLLSTYECKASRRLLLDLRPILWTLQCTVALINPCDHLWPSWEAVIPEGLGPGQSFPWGKRLPLGEVLSGHSGGRGGWKRLQSLTRLPPFV